MTLQRLLVALIACCCLSPALCALEPHRDGQQAFLSRAVFADGRVWLLTDAGELSSIAEGSDRRVDETAIPEPVHDICVHQGQLVALTCARDGCTNGSLRRREHGTWSVEATLPLRQEEILALTCEGAGVTVLTTHRLVDVEPAHRRELVLSEPIDAQPVAAVHDTPAAMFVGFNAGEWGGGLRRIDRKTGNVSAIESKAPGDLCGGPLDSDCDPVNGIVAEPWNGRCIAIAIGLVHMFAQGRIVEVCGSTVRTLYSKPLEFRSTKPGDSLSTIAFFGLSRHGDRLWASGIDGLYEIDAAGNATVSPMPEFKEIGGVYVNFDSPLGVLVLTQVNQRHSVGGAVPLLVPRR